MTLRVQRPGSLRDRRRPAVAGRSAGRVADDAARSLRRSRGPAPRSLSSARATRRRASSATACRIASSRAAPRPASGPGLTPWRRLTAAARQARPDVITSTASISRCTCGPCGRGLGGAGADHASSPDAGRAWLRRWGLRRIAGAAFTSAQQATAFKASRRLPARTPIYEIPESSSTFTAGNQQAARNRSGVHGDPALLAGSAISTPTRTH